MALVFLGKETQSGNSPTLWADGDDYVIQGFILEPDTLAEIGTVPVGEAIVRVPKQLMTHLAKDISDSTDV